MYSHIEDDRSVPTKRKGTDTDVNPNKDVQNVDYIEIQQPGHTIGTPVIPDEMPARGDDHKVI
ncbi:MAG TPA: hypothetical protein GXZ21_12480 [Clostridiales bacterium]|nr:hypothetical protein [Clostridiales bacterium]